MYPPSFSTSSLPSFTPSFWSACQSCLKSWLISFNHFSFSEWDQRRISSTLLFFTSPDSLEAFGWQSWRLHDWLNVHEACRRVKVGGKQQTPSSTPLFYSEQLDRSAAIGCTSSTWAALPFLAVPKGAANSMLLAGWQTGRREPANGRLDEAQSPEESTIPAQHQPASCHLQFGVINPPWTGNHVCPSPLVPLSGLCEL